MYMGKQYKNEAGNKASRQVKCGTRQEMKMRDERLGNLCTEKLQILFNCLVFGII